MPYIVDVNDPTQPSNNKGVGQGAEELRAIKDKLSGFGKAVAKYTFSFAIDFSALARFLGGFEASNGTLSGTLAAKIATATDAPADASHLTRKDYVDASVASLAAAAGNALAAVDAKVVALQALRLAAVSFTGDGADNVPCPIIKQRGGVQEVMKLAGAKYRITLTTPMPDDDWFITGWICRDANADTVLRIDPSFTQTTTQIQVQSIRQTGGGSVVPDVVQFAQISFSS